MKHSRTTTTIIIVIIIVIITLLFLLRDMLQSCRPRQDFGLNSINVVLVIVLVHSFFTLISRENNHTCEGAYNSLHQ